MYNGCMGHLYSINFPNGKWYIGITSRTASERFAEHLEGAASGTDTLLHRALRKHTAQLEVLKVMDSWEELCQAEKAAILEFNSKAPNGYNLTDGGDGSTGLKWTEEQKAASKRPEMMLGNRHAEGCVHTEDGLRRMKEAMIGNTHAKGKTWKVSPEKRMNYSREKSVYERGKIAAGKSLAGALRNGRPVSLLSDRPEFT